MRAISNWLKKTAFARSLKKRAPGQFAYSASNDYYVPHAFSEKRGLNILVDALETTMLRGRIWNGTEFKDEIELPLNELSDFQIQISRFYGFQRFDYEGHFKFWTQELSLNAQRAWIVDKLSQSYFNVTLKFRSDRIEVLQKLVNLHLKEAARSNGILFTPKERSIISLQADYFGNRVHSHPAYEEISSRFRFIVDSLVETGELERSQNHEYKLNAKALSTLSEYAREERRHRDNVRQNRLLFWITVVIAIAASIQAYSAFFGDKQP